MNRNILVALVGWAAIGLSAAHADIQIFACEPEWAALVRALGGEHVDVYVATTAQQDPHYIQARPSLIARVRDADLLVCSGAELEVGWLPLLLRRSGNRDIQAGENGHFFAAEQVRRLEVPERIDRAQGDIHPQGNPHVHLNPHNLLRIARALGQRMQDLDPANAAVYAGNLDHFEDRWREAIDGWEERAEPLKGLEVISQHRSFSYLADWLDLDVQANVEPKPGIPPSGAHLSRLLDQFRETQPAAIIRTPYEDPKPSDWLATRLEIPVLVLPYTVGGGGVEDLFQLYDSTIDMLLEVEP